MGEICMSTDELAHWGEFVEGVSGPLTILAAAIGSFWSQAIS